MTSRTRRATPVAVPPKPSNILPRAVIGQPRPLRHPVLVDCGGAQLELRVGSLLIGRIPECDLVMEDALVSRMHARLWLDNGGVRLEDLHSTNGVYLNGERIVRSMQLSVGDRAQVGTHELFFSELPRSSAPADPPAVAPTPSEAEFSDPPTRPHASISALPIPITARADALEMLGTLARRLANEQKAIQAPRMLEPHLQGILRGASSGLVVPERLLELASEYAIDLAHWTAEARWLDYVVELHVVTRRLMSTPALAALQRAERWIGAMDRTLLEYYVASFQGTQKQLSAAEKARLATLQRMAKKR